MKFSYTSKGADGQMKTGFIEASDKFVAAKQIREQGEIPYSIKEVTENKFVKFLNTLNFGTVGLKEKITFTKNLAGMLQAGLPLYRAISVIAKQTKNKKFEKVLDTLLDTINQGGTLSVGMEKESKVFSGLFVAMVKAGEESGGLTSALKQISENLEKTHQLNRKIRSAMMYPAVIICAILIIGILMLVYVVPTLTDTFTKIGAELPASTQFVIWLSDTMKQHFILVALAILLIAIGLWFFARLPRTKKYFDFIVVRLPVIGTLSKEINASRTTRTLSALLSSGVPVSRSLEITKDVLQNTYYKQIIDDTIKSIERGEPLSTTFKENTKLYPIMVGEMMEVGEETGNLAPMLLDITHFYEEEVETKTKDLSTIIEPVLMVLIGGAVGFFAISMITPMYSVLETIQ
jgi:type IV pilus assembly protein PilC